jgi:hypothetical protein
MSADESIDKNMLAFIFLSVLNPRSSAAERFFFSSGFLSPPFY